MPTARDRSYRYHEFQSRVGEAGMLIGTIALLIGVGTALTHIPTERDLLSFLMTERIGRVATLATLLGVAGLFWGNEHRNIHRNIQHIDSRH